MSDGSTYHEQEMHMRGRYPWLAGLQVQWLQSRPISAAEVTMAKVGTTHVIVFASSSSYYYYHYYCVWNQKTNKTKKQNKTKEIVKSLGTWWEATHELLHLHQHQSSHGDHLLDDRGGTRWWCDLLSAGLLYSRRFYSSIGPISTYQHWSALLQCVAYWVWPRLVVKGQILGSTWMVRQYIHPACWWTVGTSLTTS